MSVTVDLDTSYEPDDPEARAFIKDMKKRGIVAEYPRSGQLILKGDPKKIYNFMVHEVEWYGDSKTTAQEIQELHPELLMGDWVDTKWLRSAEDIKAGRY